MSKQEKFKENVSIRISTEDLEKIRQKADELYLNPSTLARMILLQNLKNY
jgi:predicted DNA binding CopG/RHH family protein